MSAAPNRHPVDTQGTHHRQRPRGPVASHRIAGRACRHVQRRNAPVHLASGPPLLIPGTPGSKVFAESGAQGSNHAKSACREMPGQRKNLARLGYVALRYPGLPWRSLMSNRRDALP